MTRRSRAAAAALALAAVVTGCSEGKAPCDPEDISVGSAPLAKSTGTLRSIAIDEDGDLLVAEVTTSDGTPPSVLFDTDDDRDTGMWTLQSPISSSGWDVLVDHQGAVYRHSGASNEWAWEPIGDVDDGSGWRATEDGVLVCIGPDAAAATGIGSDTMRVSAFLDAEVSLPAAFLPGAAWPEERLVQPEEPATPVDPVSLAFGYGYEPWSVAGCTTPACAAPRYASFAHVVVGSGFEEASHPSHAGVVELIAEVRRLSPATEVWGYVSLVGGPVADGHRDRVHTAEDIAARSELWKAIGVTGIFLDEADLCRGQCGTGPDGEEIRIDRPQQNAAIEAIHGVGLPVFANGFAAEDILGEVGGVPSALRSGDVYLLESPTFSGGARMQGVDALSSRARYLAARRYTEAAGIRLAAVDTFDGAVADGYRTDPRWAIARAAVPAATIHGVTNVSYSASPDLADNLPLP